MLVYSLIKQMTGERRRGESGREGEIAPTTNANQIMYLNLQKKKCFFGLLFNKLIIVDFFFNSLKFRGKKTLKVRMLLQSFNSLAFQKRQKMLASFHASMDLSGRLFILLGRGLPTQHKQLVHWRRASQPLQYSPQINWCKRETKGIPAFTNSLRED